MKKQASTLTNPAWQKNTVLFISSQAITLFGSSIVQMAIIWQVALDTSSGLWITLLSLSGTLPQLIVSFFGGVLADRYARKKLIILADSFIAVVTFMLAMAILIGRTADLLPWLLVVSMLRSLGSGIQTPAVSAVIPQIVPEEHLIRYNGINSSMLAIVQFAAPAVAGAILYLAPFYVILLLDVLTAIIGLLILLFVVIPYKKLEPSKEKVSFFSDMKSGVSYAAKNSLVRQTLLAFGTFIFLCTPSGFLSVLMIERIFGDSYMYLSVNEMAGFAGMVVGGLILGMWGGFKTRQKTMALGLICYGLFSVMLGFVDKFWLFAALMFMISFFIPIVQSSATTLLQENVPEDKLGRVFSLFGIMYNGFMPLGMAFFGPLADKVEIQFLVIFCGIAILVLGFRLLFNLSVRGKATLK
ncbi:hypothetical protein RU97_GL001134 [Enterococcus canis]|uniref:Major facilitator superfamily (MFS) profile domain-containing protein n=1 Tax=Enterococcus canis TaxID=214095 RepID=A0A1L8RIK5_9ENTE|nr:MFS transporter [Enterococcus canis]OJG19563.1 hypothetical protein RU97_GL001134 [Enterococcus canis]